MKTLLLFVFASLVGCSSSGSDDCAPGFTSECNLVAPAPPHIAPIGSQNADGDAYDQTCVDLQFDVLNCGACGNVCDVTLTCVSGKCAPDPCGAPAAIGEVCQLACPNPCSGGRACAATGPTYTCQ